MKRRNRKGDFEFFGLARIDEDGYFRIFRKRSRLETWTRVVVLSACLVITVAGICKLVN